MYCNLADLKRLKKAFEQGATSYDNKTLTMFVEAKARVLSQWLHRYGRFALPITVCSNGSVLFDDNPSDGETLTIGGTTYRFKDTPAAINDIKRGATAAATCLNLLRALEESEYDDNYYAGTTINTSAWGVRNTAGTLLTLTARKGGPSGNDIPLETDSGVLTLTAFSGGLREFPELVLVHVQLVTLAALGGQVGSNFSGGNVATGLDTDKQIEEFLGHYKGGGVLIDTTGTSYASRVDTIETDSGAHPIADMQDPVFWGHDDSRDWDRSAADE